MASSNCCMIIETSADPKTRREISEFNIFLSNDVSSHDEVSVSHLIVVKLMDFWIAPNISWRCCLPLAPGAHCSRWFSSDWEPLATWVRFADCCVIGVPPQRLNTSPTLLLTATFPLRNLIRRPECDKASENSIRPVTWLKRFSPRCLSDSEHGLISHWNNLTD